MIKMNSAYNSLIEELLSFSQVTFTSIPLLFHLSLFSFVIKLHPRQNGAPFNFEKDEEAGQKELAQTDFDHMKVQGNYLKSKWKHVKELETFKPKKYN